MSDEEMEKFDEKRGEAMSTFSEVTVLLLLLIPMVPILLTPDSTRENGRRPSDCSQKQSN